MLPILASALKCALRRIAASGYFAHDNSASEAIVMNVKSVLLAGASVLALGGGAMAADPSWPPQDVFSWSGTYFGAYLGAATTTFEDNETIYGDGQWKDQFTNVIAGGQLGYNWQTGNNVYGVVGDFTWLNTDTQAPGVSDSDYFYYRSLPWLATLRGKIGFAENDWLLYATAGVAFGATTVGQPGYFSKSETRVGWVIGAGGEHAFTPHITGFIEGLYADLGNTNSGPYTGSSGTYSESVHHTVLLGKVGLNYKW
jgi:outer membrane immunogenic protein